MLENILFSMNSTMPLFFIMLLGYVLHRTGFLSDAFVAGANKFVFYVALPVQLFRDLGKNDVRATFDGRYVLFCFAVTLACILVIWALAKLFLKSTGLVGEFVQVCYRSSAAILGSAFLQSIYGDASMWETPFIRFLYRVRPKLSLPEASSAACAPPSAW